MSVSIHTGDCRDLLRSLPDQSVHCCVTSPPYFGLRDYGADGQIGLEQTPAEFVEQMVAVFREVRRALRDDGTLWLNLGDSYAGSRCGPDAASPLKGSRNSQNATKVAKQRRGQINYGLPEKNLLGIPWRVAFALQADGWYLRQDIIWSKPNPMPESVRDRCTKAHEYLFLLSKGPRYYFDQESITEQLAPASVERLSQRSLPDQVGSARVPGKTNGNMKAVSRYSFARETKSTAGEHGQKGQHRPDRDDVEYSGRRNKRSVWTVPTMPFKEAHFATFPVALVEPCILAGCPAGGVVLDPFGGAGTTAVAADALGRDAILFELNPDYAGIARRRVDNCTPGFQFGATA